MAKDTTILEKDVILWVNIALIGVASLLLFYYVMMANTIAAENYRIQTLRDKIGSLSEINSVLMSQKLSFENLSLLSEFAKSINMIEARNISYIFENSNVAQR